MYNFEVFILFGFVKYEGFLVGFEMKGVLVIEFEDDFVVMEVCYVVKCFKISLC